MTFSFNWQALFGISNSKLPEIENSITSDLENLGIKPCHKGNIIINASIESNPFQIIAGNAKCSCGKPYVTFEGDIEPNYSVRYKEISCDN